MSAPSFVRSFAGGVRPALAGAAGSVSRLPGRVRVAAWAAPKRALVVLGAASVVLLCATVGFLLLASHRASVDTARTEALGVAQRSVAELMSYDYRSLPHDLQHRQALVTGKFKNDYTGLVSSVIEPAAVRTQMLTRSSVGAAGAEEDSGTDEVKVFMLVNQTTRSALQPEPKLLNTRLRVTMVRTDGRWLVSDLQPV